MYNNVRKLNTYMVFKKGTVDGLNINDGYVYVDGVKQELFNLKYDDWQDIWNSEYRLD